MPDRDPYEVLGVEKAASQNAIRSAYRKLAKKHHPDLNPNDAEAEQRFKEAANANAILGDPDRRAKYDRGEIDASGHDRPEAAHVGPRPRPGPRPGPGPGPGDGFMAQEGFASEEELQTFLNEMFGAGGQAGGARARRRASRGQDIVLTIAVPFLEACLGGKRRIVVPNRPPMDVTLPPALQDGEMLRLAGLGEPGFDGGPAGDAYVQAHVEPHRFFERKDLDILLDLPITFAEAVLGGTVRAPTIHGSVDLKISPNAKAGQRMRLKGKGVADRRGGFGDQYVRLRIVAPEHADAELKDCLAAWAKRRDENPRAAMEGER